MSEDALATDESDVLADQELACRFKFVEDENWEGEAGLIRIMGCLSMLDTLLRASRFVHSYANLIPNLSTSEVAREDFASMVRTQSLLEGILESPENYSSINVDKRLRLNIDVNLKSVPDPYPAWVVLGIQKSSPLHVDLLLNAASGLSLISVAIGLYFKASLLRHRQGFLAVKLQEEKEKALARSILRNAALSRALNGSPLSDKFLENAFGDGAQSVHPSIDSITIAQSSDELSKGRFKSFDVRSLVSRDLDGLDLSSLELKPPNDKAVEDEIKPLDVKREE